MSINTKIFVYSIFFLFIQLPIIAQSTILSQSDSANPAINSEISSRETRARLMGVFSVFNEENNRFYFLNINSHSFNKTTSNFQLNYATEFGVALYNRILSYIKVGPEIRLLKNIYLDGYIGLSILLLTNVYPSWGADVGYSSSLTEKISIDFELGINYYLLDNRVDNMYFPYVTIGLSVLNK